MVVARDTTCDKRRPPRGQRIVCCVNRARPECEADVRIQVSLACTGKKAHARNSGQASWATCRARGERENVFVLCHQTNVATLTQLPRWGHDNFRSFWLRCSSCAPAIVHAALHPLRPAPCVQPTDFDPDFSSCCTWWRHQMPRRS